MSGEKVGEYKKKRQIRVARLDIIAPLYRKGWTIRQMREEVMKRLDLKSYSTDTVHKDVHLLLNEWRESRIEDIHLAVQLELNRIDDIIKELWSQWEKSKENYSKEVTKQKGAPKQKDGQREISVYQLEKQVEEIVGLGDVSYIAEIRQQLIERRKLLGLYEPTKVDVTTAGQQITQIEIIHTAKESADNGIENTGDTSVQPIEGGLQRQPI